MSLRRLSRIFFCQYFRRDLDQIGVEDSGIVFREYHGDLSSIESIDLSIDLIDLGDHLHDGILDPIMHHLHIVPCTIWTDMTHTGSS